MTFPVREATATTQGGATTQPVNLPASIASRDVLLITLYSYGGAVPTTPSGWSLLTSSSGVYWYKRTANGSEGATVDFTMDTSGGSLWLAERWSGASGNVEAASAVASGDPPNLAPSWGAKDVAWVSSGGFGNGSGGGADDTTPPTSFGNQYSRGVGFVVAVSSYRTLNASSLNPAAWTAPGGAVAVTTIAIEPAAAPASSASWRGTRRRRLYY